jgi:hypothetical protein
MRRHVTIVRRIVLASENKRLIRQMVVM